MISHQLMTIGNTVVYNLFLVGKEIRNKSPFSLQNLLLTKNQSTMIVLMP